MTRTFFGNEPPRPVHPREDDRFTQTVGTVTVAVDRAGCIVMHTPAGTVTVTDVGELTSALREAQGYRDGWEQ